MFKFPENVKVVDARRYEIEASEKAINENYQVYGFEVKTEHIDYMSTVFRIANRILQMAITSFTNVVRYEDKTQLYNMECTFECTTKDAKNHKFVIKSSDKNYLTATELLCINLRSELAKNNYIYEDFVYNVLP